VLELHAGPSRAGAYVDAAFTTAAAATLHLDTTFTAKYTGAAFAQALYLDRGGARDLVIAATETNEVTAFDPTGAMAWQVELGAPQPMPNAAEGANCGNINPLGITGTPVIDAAGGTLYLDAMIRENNAAHHRIFALSVDDGSTRPGWPVDVGTALTGTACWRRTKYSWNATSSGATQVPSGSGPLGASVMRVRSRSSVTGRTCRPSFQAVAISAVTVDSGAPSPRRWVR